MMFASQSSSNDLNAEFKSIKKQFTAIKRLRKRTWRAHSIKSNIQIMIMYGLKSQICEAKISLYITMTSKWVRWRLKSPASRLFTPPFIRVQIKVNIKAPRHWTLLGIYRGPVNSPHKWPVSRKCFHLMTLSWWAHKPIVMTAHTLFYFLHDKWIN